MAETFSGRTRFWQYSGQAPAIAYDWRHKADLLVGPRTEVGLSRNGDISHAVEEIDTDHPTFITVSS